MTSPSVSALKLSCGYMYINTARDSIVVQQNGLEKVTSLLFCIVSAVTCKLSARL